MSKLSSLLFGAALGAGLLYFMDPQQGDRRKAMVRDRALRLRGDANDAIQSGVRDLRHRTRGVLAEAMAVVSEEGPTDELIAERVRARMGYLSRHPGAVRVNVMNKTATLSGDVLANEVEGMLAGVKKIRGVKSIENQLRVHETAGNIPQLQGEGWMPGDRVMWSPSTRLLAGGGALYLILYSLAKGGILGTFARLGGIALGARAITNQPLSRMVGLTQDPDAIRVRKTINIAVPVDQVYDLWANFENFPQFMSNVEEIRDLGEGRSHWTVKGPAGSKVEFDAVITEDRPNEVVAWQTVEDSQVKHHGQVRFKEAQAQGTQVSVNMAYTPPAGVVGHAVASVFGVDPKSSMDKDLARMKSLLEEGKTTAKGQKVTGDKVMGRQGTGTTNRQSAQIPRTGEDQQSGGRRSGKKAGSQGGGGQENLSGEDPGIIPMTGMDQDRMSGASELDVETSLTSSGEDRVDFSDVQDSSSDITNTSYEEDAMTPPGNNESGDEENSHPLSDQ